MVERKVEIHYGPRFANDIRDEGVEKTLKYWEALMGVSLEHEFPNNGGLFIREKKNEKT